MVDRWNHGVIDGKAASCQDTVRSPAFMRSPPRRELQIDCRKTNLLSVVSFSPFAFPEHLTPNT